MLRQIEFALFDIRIHAGYDPAEGARPLDVLDAVRSEVALVRHPSYNRFPHSFSHIFAGGYAAGSSTASQGTPLIPASAG